MQKLGVEVLTISVDSIFVHKVWDEQELSKMAEGGAKFPMLADQGGKIGTMYGVYDEENFIDNRGRFIIDPDGNIQAFEVVTPPVGRNLAETIRLIEALQHVRSTKGKEATPADWKKGEKTLKPGADLVGKVWQEWKVKK